MSFFNRLHKRSYTLDQVASACLAEKGPFTNKRFPLVPRISEHSKAQLDTYLALELAKR